jgi:hypothetical protein
VDENENVIYLYENTKELYSMLSTNLDTGFSNKIVPEVGGNIGDFSVMTAEKDKNKQLYYAYSSNLWSICK